MSPTIIKSPFVPLIAIFSSRKVLAFLCLVIALMVGVQWEFYRERARVAESERYLQSVRCAQETYRLAHGKYATNLAVLDLDRPEPTDFAVGELRPGETGELATSWSLTLRRFCGTAFYGAYEVTFNEGGFDASRSTVDARIRRHEVRRPSLANFVIH
jgi:type II secretory pathway pseudopilin PulG